MRRIASMLAVFALVVACGSHYSGAADQKWTDIYGADTITEFHHNHGVLTAPQGGVWKDFPETYFEGRWVSGDRWKLSDVELCMIVGHNDVGMEWSTTHQQKAYPTECVSVSTLDLDEPLYLESVYGGYHVEGHLDIVDSWVTYKGWVASSSVGPIEYHDPDGSNPVVNGVVVCGRTTSGAKNPDCFGV